MTNPAVMHGLCAMKSAMYCSLRLAQDDDIILLVNEWAWLRSQVLFVAESALRFSLESELRVMMR